MIKELKFLVNAEQGEVSAILMRPEQANALIVLGHGASTSMRHANLQNIAERMAAVGIATFRYNFPYSEHGRGRDSQPVCVATVRAAVAKGVELAPGSDASGGRPLLRGTHDVNGFIVLLPLERRSGTGFLFISVTFGGKSGDQTGRAP